jgi:hypothetical protein
MFNDIVVEVRSLEIYIPYFNLQILNCFP